MTRRIFLFIPLAISLFASPSWLAAQQSTDPFADPSDDRFGSESQPSPVLRIDLTDQPDSRADRVDLWQVSSSGQLDSRTPFISAYTSDSEREAEIAAFSTLEKHVSLEFIDVALADAILHISQSVGFPISLDLRALDEVGIGTDTPVNCSVKRIRLESAMEVLLRPLDLFLTFRSGCWEITTMEHLEQDLMVRIYDVSDLAGIGMGMVVNGTISTKERVEKLCDTIQTTIHPELWEDVGGSGVIETQGHIITISQSWPIQNKVLAYLNSLYEIAIPRSINSLGLGGFSTRVYRLQMAVQSKTRVNNQGYTMQSERSSNRRVGLTILGTAPAGPGGMGSYINKTVVTDIIDGPRLKQLSRLIKKSVAPVSWKGRYGGSIQASGRMLIVSQSSDIHIEVERFLREIGAMYPYSSTNATHVHFGGGSFGGDPSQSNQNGGFQE